jgi:hypothetical protein
MAEDEIPEPIPRRSDIAKGLRTVYLNRVAHMGMMLDKVNRQNRRAERIEKFAATGDVKTLDAPESEEEDMGVNIGNEFHFHEQAPATAKPEAAPTPTATKPEASPEDIALKILARLKKQRDLEKASKASATASVVSRTPAPAQNKWLVPLLLASSLVTGGGFVGMVVNDYLQKPVAQTIDTDTDTSTDVTFPK